MVVKPFNYFAPKSLEEASAILLKYHGDAKILAGGQSLLPIMKLNLAEISYLVDIKRIPNMAFIKIDREPASDNKEALFIGALTTHSEVLHSGIVRRTIPLLTETASGIGHPLVRNRGTIGGSLSHCDPAADLCVTSLALDAKMIIAGHDNARRFVSAEKFIQGTFTTDLQEGEILEKVCFPIPPAGTGYGFEKLTLGHGDFPLLVVSVLLRMNMMEDKTCEDAIIAVGGVAESAIRIKQAEETLRGKNEVGPEDIELASKTASELSNPAADLEVSAGYKKKMVKVLVRRALNKAMYRSSINR